LKLWNIEIEVVELFLFQKIYGILKLRLLYLLFFEFQKKNYFDTICQLLVAGTVSLNWYLLFAVGSWRSGKLVKLDEEEECF
jgi:hypothetical protein